MLVYVKACGWKWLSCHAGHQEISRCRTRGESEESIAHRRQRVYKPLKRLPELGKVTSTEKSLQNFPLTAICFCLICMHYISPSRLLLEDIIPLANPTGHCRVRHEWWSSCLPQIRWPIFCLAIFFFPNVKPLFEGLTLMNTRISECQNVCMWLSPSIQPLYFSLMLETFRCKNVFVRDKDVDDKNIPTTLCTKARLY